MKIGVKFSLEVYLNQKQSRKTCSAWSYIIIMYKEVLGYLRLIFYVYFRNYKLVVSSIV